VSATAPIVPGTREPGLLTTFGVPIATLAAIPDGPVTMDATTIAERQREGGGAPSQRRRSRERAPWNGFWRWLQERFMTRDRAETFRAGAHPHSS
jgi:hypothetical protein